MPHYLYDFRNKSVVEYQIDGLKVETYYIISMFFVLSALFQAFNGAFVGFEGSHPRILCYAEYSISSSLMVVVLAVNVGILEVYSVTSFVGLFFGMNILGACAEIMSRLQDSLYWMLPHFAAWILFLFAYVPVLVSYEQARKCSVAVPWFLTMAIYVEFFFFLCFGVLQSAILFLRMFEHPDWLDYIHDLCNIILSIVAKTFLAYALIGPALSMNELT